MGKATDPQHIKRKSDPSDLIERARRKQLALSEEERGGIIARARARAEMLRHAGISEEEILAEFDEWRHRQGSGR